MRSLKCAESLLLADTSFGVVQERFLGTSSDLSWLDLRLRLLISERGDEGSIESISMLRFIGLGSSRVVVRASGRDEESGRGRL
jgi:hypothetical protein